jgi:hypothetical protein
MNEARTECQQGPQQKEDKLLDILKKTGPMKLKGVPCEVSEHCGMLAFKAEKQISGGCY